MIYWYESLNSEIYDLKLFNENKLGEKGAHLGNVETRPSKIKGVYIWYKPLMAIASNWTLVNIGIIEELINIF